MSDLPVAAKTAMTTIDGPERRGSEQRWRVRLADGRRALLGRLLPELADDPAIRRRYVRDLDRLADVSECGIAPLIERGPLPDPRNPRSPPPWRLRLDPPGTTLAAWLRSRSPAPVDEVSALGATLAERLAALHDRGVILRDLAPRGFVLGEDGELWLTDVGLTRVDILSTRTAASLLVESSPYASPEQLTRTLGVILYQALTGVLPFGDGPALLREDQTAPPPSSLRPGIPAALDEVIGRCLQIDPEARPPTAREVASILRGEAPATASMERASCQACGASLRLGQRLCLGCGSEAVLFEHTEVADDNERWALELTRGSEDADFGRRLRAVLGALSTDELPPLNLVIGDARMYSKAELARRHRLPLRLFDDLSKETAEELKARLKEEKLVTRVVRKPMTVGQGQRKVAMGIVAGVTVALSIGLFLLSVEAGLFAAGIGVVILIIIAVANAKRKKPKVPLLRLRPAPAALPASDPLVTRLASLLQEGPSDDVREQIAELALLIQRLVDHRASVVGGRAELDRILEPIVPLVELIEAQTRGLIEIDRELADLDEGAMVRALGSSEARGEEESARAPILAGLDRLRALEDQRARALHRLLSAGDLLRRTADLGLAVHDPEAIHERQVALALKALGAGDSGDGSPT